MTCSSVNCCVCLSKGNESSEYNGRGRNKKNEKEKERIQGNCVCVLCVVAGSGSRREPLRSILSSLQWEKRQTGRERGCWFIYSYTQSLRGVCVCVSWLWGEESESSGRKKKKGGGDCFGRRDGHSQIIYTASIWFHRQPSFSRSIDFTPVGPTFRMIYANLCCCPLQIPGLQITEMRCSITSPSAGSDTELIVMKALVLLRPY